jgi:hypothetical protein
MTRTLEDIIEEINAADCCQVAIRVGHPGICSIEIPKNKVVDIAKSHAEHGYEFTDEYWGTIVGKRVVFWIGNF